ncbi:hypothetical protein [Sinorhizobium meliloti]|uniref:hypothetical protein n=1 Tax=Rhizobium meliloti TaxID=382 RepID=UPI000FDBC773|nr:hypothetical protein [Sinorhizobium meliloti]RVG82712.1 hypothetical protein CN219_20180 [Sinorhizobium meliloti]RVI37703.1 hypothetical protein CN197_07985 [Sinorhizobium meliloti]RVI46117.1 hypothetical protein CN196_10825 [Sinorhizobium meliloti]RVJ26083.1 hypothetical protein CN177_12410 [Sinorhizobium meliloti]RVK00386.1 hypothetical protein CN170_13290 [Sinorhizobium meliloti]
MARIPSMAAAALALASSFPLICVTATPASAQSLSAGDDGGDISASDVRDFLRDALRARSDRRDLIRDLVPERQDRRDELLDLLGDGGDLMGDRGDRLERLRDLLAARRDRRDELMDLIGDRDDQGGGRGLLRQRLLERLADGNDENCVFITRSLRAENGDWMAFVRRRVCRD